MLKTKLASGQTVIGSWISSGNTAVAEIFAKAGFDWVAVDLEHSAINISQVAELIRVIDLAGSAPLVRLTANDPNQIKRVLDAGAHGIIVPMVNTCEEARAAVRATQYPPAGARGVGLSRAQGYGAAFDQYKEWQSNGITVVVQIENVKAIEQLEGIFCVEGVDAYMVGPYDLSNSLGIPGQFKNKQFTSLLAKINNIGIEMNCPAGIHVVEPNEEQLKMAVNEGYRFIAYSVDFRMLDATSRNGLKSIGRNK